MQVLYPYYVKKKKKKKTWQQLGYIDRCVAVS